MVPGLCDARDGTKESKWGNRFGVDRSYSEQVGELGPMLWHSSHANKIITKLVWERRTKSS